MGHEQYSAADGVDFRGLYRGDDKYQKIAFELSQKRFTRKLDRIRNLFTLQTRKPQKLFL